MWAPKCSTSWTPDLKTLRPKLWPILKPITITLMVTRVPIVIHSIPRAASKTKKIWTRTDPLVIRTWTKATVAWARKVTSLSCKATTAKWTNHKCKRAPNFLTARTVCTPSITTNRPWQARSNPTKVKTMPIPVKSTRLPVTVTCISTWKASRKGKHSSSNRSLKLRLRKCSTSKI